MFEVRTHDQGVLRYGPFAKDDQLAARRVLRSLHPSPAPIQTFTLKGLPLERVRLELVEYASSR